MALIQARFKLDVVTKGAVRYHEVNDRAEPEPMREKIGALYIRKTAFAHGASFAKILEVTIEGVPEKEDEVVHG